MSKPATSTPTLHATVQNVPLTMIDVEPQIRTRNGFDAESIASLAASIQAHGLMQPVILEVTGDRFRMIAGHRRLAAFQHLGEQTIPALTRSIDALELPQVQIIENIQREQLMLADTAAGVRTLLDTLKKPALVAKALGKSAAWVSKHQTLTAPTFTSIARELLESEATDDLELILCVNQLAKLPGKHTATVMAFVETVKTGHAGRNAARDLLAQLKADNGEGDDNGEGEGEGDGNGDGDDSPPNEVFGKLELSEGAARLMLKALHAMQPSRRETTAHTAACGHLQDFITKTWGEQ